MYGGVTTRQIDKNVKFKLFKKYNKVKYLLRIKHFRGRSVHSPFMYQLVRKALMNKRGKHLTIDKPLFYFFIKHGYSESSARRLCRIYTYLDFEKHQYYNGVYSGEDFLVMNVSTTMHDFELMTKQIRNSGKLVCVSINSIYENISAHNLWQYILSEANAVTIDLYHEGVLIFDENLHKQNYKMKF